MGDRQRFSPEGPRDLDEQDFRPDDLPKVIQNPEEQVIKGAAAFQPLLPIEQLRELKAVMDQRAGSQRGKPRSRTPDNNPMGGRVFDMDCTWPMYRSPYQQGFRYVCAAYLQSHGQRCHYNHVDGPTAVRFVMSCIRQRVLRPDRMAELRERLKALAQRDIGAGRDQKLIESKRLELRQVESRLDLAGKNLAFAQNEAQFARISKEFDQLTNEQLRLKNELATLERDANGIVNIDAEVDAAMTLALSLVESSVVAEDYLSASRLFNAVNAKLFIRFRDEPWGKRLLRKAACGVLTMGSEPPPIKLYSGPTDCDSVKNPAAALAADSSQPQCCGPKKETSPRLEGDSSRNVHRGDLHSFEPSAFVEAFAALLAEQPAALENTAARLMRAVA